MLKKFFVISVFLAVTLSKSLLKSRKVQTQRPYGLLTPEEEASHCRSITAPIYEFCRRMADCNMCLETDHCGWCQNRCIPGIKALKACVNSPDFCPKEDYLLQPSQCSTPKMHIGKFKNIAHDATYLINPTIATPNIDVKITDNVQGFSHFTVPMNPASQEFGLHGLRR